MTWQDWLWYKRQLIMCPYACSLSSFGTTTVKDGAMRAWVASVMVAGQA
ncbi:MAG TPA: hypothetical protein VM163_09450 [bacterium]|nr:hypothetical protein [bacterium]